MKKNKSEQKPFIKKEALNEANEWIIKEKENIPEAVYLVLIFLLGMAGKMDKRLQNLKCIQALLMKAWKISPSSEKIQNTEDSSNTNNDRKHQKKLKDKSSKKRSKKVQKNRKTAIDKKNKHQIRDSEDEESLKKSFNNEGPLHPQCGNDSTSSAAELQSVIIDQENQRGFMEKTSQWDPEQIRKEFIPTAIRELDIRWFERNIELERWTNTKTGEYIQAENPFAPAGSRYSYATIANMLVLHVGNQIPLHRLARLFANAGKDLSKSVIFWFVTFAANAFLPIFFVLCKQLAKSAQVIEMDDAHTRINETDSHAILEKLVNNPKTAAQKIASEVHATVGLGDQNEKKTRKAFLTLLTGLLDSEDPLSRVVIKLTHFGQAGNLLGRLLEKFRDSKIEEDLWIVSDLSNANIPRVNLEKLKIKQAGCLWHSRRRFFADRSLDDLMSYALRCFSAFADLDRWLKTCVDTPEQIAQRRSRFGKKIKKILIHACTLIQKKWPKGTAPWRAAEYFFEHEVALTQFIKHPFLPISNNRCERLLRPEKLMLSSSKFRDTMGGRVCYDVIATLIASCGTAQVKFFDYACDVMKNREEVKRNPENWTPIAWRERQKQSWKV